MKTLSLSNIESYINEICTLIKSKLNNTFSLNISGITIDNNRFLNGIGEYTIKSMFNDIFRHDNIMKLRLDNKYMSYDIIIKTIKDNRFSSFTRMFTKEELVSLESANTVVLFVNYSQHNNSFTINQITICNSIDVVNDRNVKKTINRMSNERKIKF